MMTQEKILAEYMPISEVATLLGYHRHTGREKIKELAEKGFIECLEVTINKTKSWVQKSSFEAFLKKLESDYIVAEQVVDLYAVALRTVKENKNLNKIVIGRNHYFLKSEIEELYDYNDYLSLAEICEKTNLSNSVIYLFVNDDTIFRKVKKRGPHYFVHKDCVEKLIQDIRFLRSNYYTSKETRDMLMRKSTNDFTKYFRHIRRPLIANAFDQSESGSNFLYAKEDVDLFYEQNIRKQLGPRPDDPYDYFCFLIDDVIVPHETKETLELMHRFVQTFLSSSTANQKSLDKMMKTCSKLTIALSTFSIKKELHLFTNEEIFLLMKYVETQPEREQFYNFITFLSEKKLCKFNIKKITNPRKFREKSEEDDVYTFEEFLSIYEMTSTIDLHIEEALKSSVYASTWLYILIHLTNAWRHSDIIRIPQITPEVIGVHDLNWLKNHQLNLPLGQQIINQIYNFELEISKTGMKRHFFCGKDLVIPVATSMMICEFHRRKTNQLSLIDFNTPYNNPNVSTISKFFAKSEKTRKIKFSSLKMNRSLMEHLFYSIQRQQGKGNSAFELVQKMRNHSTDITKEYIRLNNEQDDFGSITKQLFIRGEFGYIYDELIDVMTQNENHSLEERTNEIERTKQFLKPIEVEATMGFLNKRMNEKNSIINEIRTLKPEEAFEQIRKLYLNEMPSKVEHVQCFVHPKCHRNTSENACLSCPFAIPNIYALHTLKEEVLSVIKNYQSANTNGTKKKYARNLEYMLDLLAQALQEFGEEVVWSFIEGGEKRLEDELKKLN